MLSKPNKTINIMLKKKINLKKKLKGIKLLLLDVDGILTTGKKNYSTKGEVLSKSFCDLDFTAIKIFKYFGIETVFISGDKTCNKEIALNRNIDFIYTRKGNLMIDKAEFLKQIEIKYKVNRKEIIFLGDDIFDMNIGLKAGLYCVPKNSFEELKKKADLILKNESGNFLVKEILDKYLKILNIKLPDPQEIADLEKHEKQKY